MHRGYGYRFLYGSLLFVGVVSFYIDRRVVRVSSSALSIPFCGMGHCGCFAAWHVSSAVAARGAYGRHVAGDMQTRMVWAEKRALLCNSSAHRSNGALLALGTIPYNWDSMTYHLPRIAYWRQNRSIAHYATNCIRQISSPVLAEFVNLHVYILCRGHDWFLICCRHFLISLTRFWWAPSQKAFL